MNVIQDKLAVPVEGIESGVHCYIKNLNTNSFVKFKETPDSFTETYSANYSVMSVLARSVPVEFYQGGTQRQITFSVTFHDDLVRSLQGMSLDSFVNKIRAMSYPEYYSSVNSVHPPLVYASIYNRWTFYGYLNSGIVMKLPVIEGSFAVATVDFTFIGMAHDRDMNKIWTSKEVENGI